jgi:hypothetical protein
MGAMAPFEKPTIAPPQKPTKFQIPMLDSIISDITDRFSEKLTNFVDLNILIPSNLVNVDDIDMREKIS